MSLAIVADADDPVGMVHLAPYAGCAIGLLVAALVAIAAVATVLPRLFVTKRRSREVATRRRDVSSSGSSPIW